MKKKIILTTLLGSILSFAFVRADVIVPGQEITSVIANGISENVLVSSGIAVAILALLAWLVIILIKKKNAPKPTKRNK